MISIKNGTLFRDDFLAALGGLYRNAELHAPVALRVMKVAKAVDAELESIRKLVSELPEETRAAKFKELLEADSALDLERIPFSKLGDIKVSPAVLGLLEDLLDLDN